MTETTPKNAHLWARHPEDWYVEPEWCSRRLFEVEPFGGRIWDPSCGTGRIVRAARERGHLAVGTDLVMRSPVCSSQEDFLRTTTRDANIVSNPPFGVADDYARKALRQAVFKIALLLPTKWMNSAKRGAWLETTPLATVWLLAPRPSMPPGPVIEAGEKPGNGTVDYCWMVWDKTHTGAPVIRWLRRDK